MKKTSILIDEFLLGQTALFDNALERQWVDF
jgi:hypothetical protein